MASIAGVSGIPPSGGPASAQPVTRSGAGCSTTTDTSREGTAIRSVYLAARIRRRDELNRYRTELEALGIEVTSRWLTMPIPEDWTDEVWAHLAQLDREDVLRADGLVLFAEPELDGGSGRHVEFGMALALNKPIIVVGRYENLFQRLPEVQVVEDWAGAVKLLTQPSMSLM